MIHHSSCGLQVDRSLFSRNLTDMRVIWFVFALSVTEVLTDMICNSPEVGTLLTGDSVSPYNTITFPQYANPADGYYTGYKISITSGTGR